MEVPERIEKAVAVVVMCLYGLLIIAFLIGTVLGVIDIARHGT